MVQTHTREVERTVTEEEVFAVEESGLSEHARIEDGEFSIGCGTGIATDVFDVAVAIEMYERSDGVGANYGDVRISDNPERNSVELYIGAERRNTTVDNIKDLFREAFSHSLIDFDHNDVEQEANRIQSVGNEENSTETETFIRASSADGYGCEIPLNAPHAVIERDTGKAIFYNEEDDVSDLYHHRDPSKSPIFGEYDGYCDFDYYVWVDDIEVVERAVEQ